MSDAHNGLTYKNLAKYIDHTLLKAEAGPADIDRLCDEAEQYGFFSVCVNGVYVSRCAANLKGTDVKVCAVAGFPLGAMCGRAKAYEAGAAVEDGAGEIDMVMNIGALKSGELKVVEDDMAALRKVCSGGVLLKVIIETCLLTTDEIVLACRIAKNSGLDFVKTSTGFSSAGATPEHVALMRKTVGPAMGVKAAGGVRSFSDAAAMINAGASRLGTSGGVNILKGQAVKGY
ncbi:MAG: deoxyribose-phosphate aldolase [Treponema sp.]|jgi:deoxyribose-phosphate aldolase|nr:deoxyribose-phosphate aldolase [Treponema sp.]